MQLKQKKQRKKVATATAGNKHDHSLCIHCPPPQQKKKMEQTHQDHTRTTTKLCYDNLDAIQNQSLCFSAREPGRNLLIVFRTPELRGLRREARWRRATSCQQRKQECVSTESAKSRNGCRVCRSGLSLQFWRLWAFYGSVRQGLTVNFM